jgi:WD40 repeat protein
MTLSFDAYVTAVIFDAAGEAHFALGDGTVRTAAGAAHEAHDGAVLDAVAHPSGQGILTGGDDGRVVWSRGGETAEIAKVPGRWIDALDASADSKLVAFAAGKELHVRDLADPGFSRVFAHERSVAGLAFDPKGRRIAAATYGGAWLWYARIADQKPQQLKWAGSHVKVAWSPDGRFLMSAMQENALHGWRVADEKNMRMGGYPAKVKSMAFLAKGQLMATSGANGAVVWPFAGSNGPMGKQAAEVVYDESAMVVRVASAPNLKRLAAGLDDGRVWVCDLDSSKTDMIKAEKGPAITALAITAKGDRLAWGDEDGGAGVVELAR